MRLLLIRREQMEALAMARRAGTRRALETAVRTRWPKRASLVTKELGPVIDAAMAWAESHQVGELARMAIVAGLFVFEGLPPWSGDFARPLSEWRRAPRERLEALLEQAAAHLQELEEGTP